jgi:transposase InsO family protein
MKFAFIHAEKASFPVAALCRLLGVTRQGYYAYANRPPSERLKRERALPAACATSPRQEPGHVRERWVTDITYICTNEGWCYLAAILDLFSRTVVGWALDSTLSTSLPRAALDRAVRRPRPSNGLLHHSDRGCQYTSAEYRGVLAELGVTVSMSRKGNCWDNAVAESFFATLKTELIYGRTWPTRLELRAAVFEYIEVFYNRLRLHSSVDYRTPAQVESDFAVAKAA